MAKKKKAPDLRDSVHKIWLAGLGAFATAEEEGEKLFRSLVKKGSMYERDLGNPVKTANEKVRDALDQVRGRATRAGDKVESVVDGRVTNALRKLGVPTRKEVEALTRKVEQLTAKLNGGPTRKTATRKTKATTKVAAGRKTSQRKIVKRKTAKAATSRSRASR